MTIPVTFQDSNSPDLEAAVLNGMQRQLMQVATTATPTTTYTLVLADAGSCVEVSHATAQIAVVIPTNSSVPFPIGTVIEVARMGAGPVVIFPNTGVTWHSPDSDLYLSRQYSTASLRKRGTDDWHIVGDLKATA